MKHTMKVLWVSLKEDQERVWRLATQEDQNLGKLCSKGCDPGS